MLVGVCYGDGPMTLRGIMVYIFEMDSGYAEMIIQDAGFLRGPWRITP